MDSGQVGNVHVHVVYPNDRAAGLHLRVRLMTGSGSTPVAENLTTDQGTTDFNGVSVGEYHVIVSGEGIEETDSGQFEVDRRRMSQSLFVTVRPAKNPDHADVTPGSSTVATVDLKIPKQARKEFDKASKAMADHDWAKALEKLNEAIAIYPQYAAAYNNLGVVYGQLNDSMHEHEALQNAIRLNDHFAPAFVNLAKLSLREHDSSHAEALLEDAVRLEPADVQNIMLLAEAQLLNKHFDAAVASARKVHAMSGEHPAVVHYIAARALERQNRPKEALAELRLFLTEEPQGPRSDQVRGEIAQIQHQNK
ncbi:MAG TPA: tetratricopeptide repeat protein [Candidatus Dormibacteraeota bacterium]|nr:tetratricopeptide repeat protein [Candidatus Dormibacteraeota bacterium]